MVSDGLVKVSKVHTSVPSISIPKASRGVPHVPYGFRNRKKLNINRQHAKSLADIMLGNPITGTLQLQHTLEDAGLEEFIGRPISGRIAGFLAMTKERTIDPLINGELGKAFINSLESAGDTLDALANPVKALLPMAGGGTYDDFLKSMGWLEGEYRKTYQWDTGNFLVDLAGEIISDPVNWFTWGSSALKKQATKTIIGGTDAMLDGVDATIKKTAQQATLKNILDQMPSSYKRKVEKGLLEFIEGPESEETITQLRKTFDSLRGLDVDYKAFNKVLNNVRRASEAGLYDAYKTIATKANKFKAVDTWLSKASWVSTPIGTSIMITKDVLPAVRKYISNSYVEGLNKIKFNNPADVNKLTSDFETLNKSTVARAVEVTDAVKSSILPVLEAHDLDYNKATNLYLDMVTNAGAGNRSYKALKKAYQKNLESMLPGVYIAKAKDIIWNKVTKGTKNALNTSSDIIKLSVPIKLGTKNIDTIIPESLFSNFFYNISGLGNTMFYGKNDLINESVTMFKKELSKYFKKTVYGLQYKSLQEISAKSKLPVRFLQNVLNHVGELNMGIKDLKKLVYDAIKKADLDRQSKTLLWRRVKDPDIMLQLSAYADIMRLTSSEDYKTAYNALLNIINKQMSLYNETNISVYLNKVLTLFNDINATTQKYNRIQLYPIENILDYIDNGFLRINNKVYHLNNIDAFINEILKTDNNDMRTYYLSILDYFGIRRDNATMLSELLRKRDKKSLDQIRILLEQGKTGRRTVSKTLDNYSDSVTEGYAKAVNIPKTHKEVTKVLEQLPKDSKELDTVVQYEKSLNKTITKLQTANDELHNMMISNINVSGMHQLEAVAQYTNIDLVEFDELWHSIKDFDYTNLDLDSYKNLLTHVSELETMLNTMDSFIRTARAPINESLLSFFTDLQDMIKFIQTPEVINSALEQIDLNESLYKLLLSRAGMYNIVNENVFNNLQADYKEWIDALKTPDSMVRNNYFNIVGALRNAGEDEAADSLANFVLKLDTHTAINRLMQFEVKGKFLDFDKDISDFINALPYNKVANEKYANLNASNLLNNLETITDDIMQDVKSYKGNAIKDAIYKRMAEITNVDAYIMQDAARYGLQVEFVDALDTSDMLGVAMHNENKIRILKNVPREVAINNLGYKNSKDIAKLNKLITSNDDAKLLTYYHELGHFTNNDRLKNLDISDVFYEINERKQSIEYLRRFKNPNELYNYELKNIQGNVILALNQYLKHILDSEATLNLSGTRVYSYLDSKTLNNFRYLVDNKEKLVKILEDSDTIIDAESDLSTITKYIYGANFDKNLNDCLNNLSSSSGADLEDFFQKGTYNSVAAAFYDALEIISSENERLAGAVGDIKDLTKIQNLMTKSKLNQTIRDLGSHTNFYDWSIANNYISSRKVFDMNYAIQQGIQPNKVIRATSNNEYLKFYGAYEIANKRAVNIARQYNKETLRSVKAGLIHTYQYPGAKGAPVNARTYFGLLDVDDPDDALRIVTWDLLTRMSDFSKENKRRFEKYLGEKTPKYYPTGTFTLSYNRADFFRHPYKWYEAVDAATDATNLVDIEGVSDIINMDPPVTVLEDLYQRVDYDISTLSKSPEHLKESKIDYINYINDDLAARKRLDRIQKFNTYQFDKVDKYAPGTIKKIEEQTALEQVQFKEADLRVGENKYNTKGYNYMKHQREDIALQTVLQGEASDIRGMLDNVNAGFMFVFAKGNYPFKATQEELSKLGIIVHKFEDDLWGIRRTTNEIKSNKIKWRIKPSAFQEGHNMLNSIMKDNAVYLNLDDMKVPVEVLTGDTMDTDLFDFIKSSKLFKDFLGDSVIQKSYIFLNSDGLTDFYVKNYPKPQLSIIGIDGYNRFLDYIGQHNDGPVVHFARKSNRLDSSVSAGMMEGIQRHNRETKLMSLFFNYEYSLDNPTFTRMLADTSDSKIKDFFKKGNYVAAVIREDSKGRPRVHRYIITNRKDLNKAIELGAHVFPEEIFRNMSLTINHHKIDNRALKIYKQLIMAGYKTIWLTSPGAALRNFADSAVYRNANELGGISALTDVFKYEFQAAKLLDFYDKVQAEVFKRTGGNTFNKEVLTHVLNSFSPRDRELYYITDIFVRSGASGGLSKSFEEFLLQFNKTASGNTQELWEDTVAKLLFEGKYSPVRITLDLNSKIEQTSRFGLFLGLINQGEDVSSALQHVIKTHFDYVYKTGGEELLEDIFWFITFPINNILYYINEGLSGNPTMAKLLMDANELSWNNGEYTYDNLKEKPYLQYHVMAGNIRIRTKDGKHDIIIKLGPSLFDFLQFMSDPVGSFKERLNPFLAVLTGQEGLSELNPINSQLGRAQKIIQGKSLLPSIYTKWDVKEYIRPEYKPYQYRSTWNFKRRPRKGRRIYPVYTSTRTYNRRYYTDKYYFKYTKNYKYREPVPYEYSWDPSHNNYHNVQHIYNRERIKITKLVKPSNIGRTYRS